MFWLVFILTLGFSAFAEVLAANAGWVLPLMPVCAFYFSMKVPHGRVLPFLVMASAALDAVWMHGFPSQSLAIVLIGGGTAAWKRYGDLDSWVSLTLSALGVGLAAWLADAAGIWFAAFRSMTQVELGRRLLLQLVAALLLTPIYALVLDRLLQHLAPLREDGSALTEDAGNHL